MNAYIMGGRAYIYGEVGNSLIGAEGVQSAPSIAALKNGHSAAVFRDTSWGEPGLTLQIMNDVGAPLVPRIRVDAPNSVNYTSLELEPDVTALDNGFILVTWTQIGTGFIRGIYGRIYDASGNAVSINGSEKAFLLDGWANEQVDASSVAGLLEGKFVTTWTESTRDGNTLGPKHINAQVDQIERLTAGDNTAETLTGDELVDVMRGNGGNDTLRGMGADDRLEGGSGEDTLAGGDGDDRLSGGTADDKLYGGSGLDLLTGETGDDLLDASTGNDRVYGNDGEDVLYGGTGNDQVYGGNHDDRLYGDTGRDTLTGGAGLDKFVYRALSDSTSAASGRDTIEDFTRGQGDKIHLSTLDANANKAGDQAFKFIGDDAFSKTAGELRYTQSGGNTYIMADVNGDGASDFIIQFDLTRTFIATDFVL